MGSWAGRRIEAVPRTPWLGYGIQPVSCPLTPSTEGKTGLRSTNPMYGRRPLTPGANPAGACSVRKAPHRQPMHCQRRFVYQNIRNQQGFIFILFPSIFTLPF